MDAHQPEADHICNSPIATTRQRLKNELFREKLEKEKEKELNEIKLDTSLSMNQAFFR